MFHQKYQYPKLTLLLFSFILTFLLAKEGFFHALFVGLHGSGYLMVLIGGLFFSFGFTTPIGIAMLIEAAPAVNPYAAALLGGFGAMLMDQLILQFVEFSFHDEFLLLRQTAPMRALHRLFHHERITDRIRNYLLWSVAGLVIVSPLPDEIGITILNGITPIESRRFAVICFVLNAIGVFLVIVTTRAIV